MGVGRGAATRALPPANEIAGFVVGAALVGLCLGGARLDGIIARAQARGLGGTEGARERRAANGGAVFVVPEDADEEVASVNGE